MGCPTRHQSGSDQRAPCASQHGPEAPQADLQSRSCDPSVGPLPTSQPSHFDIRIKSQNCHVRSIVPHGFWRFVRDFRPNALYPIALIFNAILPVTAVGFLTPISASAQSGYSGNDLYAVCVQFTSEASEAYCSGTIVSFSRGLDIGSLLTAEKTMPNHSSRDEIRYVAEQSVGVCKDPEVTYGQDVLVVKNFLSRNPQRLHEPAMRLVISALREAYPCE